MADALPPVLEELGHRARQRADQLDRRTLLAQLRDAPSIVNLKLGPFGIIAEFKSASPSAGALTAPGSRDTQVLAYAEGGAAAISVLTEPTRFGGSLDDLRAVAALVNRPVLRKDFVVDPLQVLEARAAGASGVLLMACLLDDDPLVALVDKAGEHGLFVLAEAHDEAERARVMDAFRRVGTSPDLGLVGINTRDFTTLTTHLDRLAALAPPSTSTRPWVAESGLSSPEDAAMASRLGYRLGLVGTALMRSDNPAQALRDLIAAGRRAREVA
ncbi:MAG: indole-3-glycerol-phosphate synthase [Myxococcota bacterium]